MISQHMMADPLSLGVQHQLGNHRATCKPLTIGSSIRSSIIIILYLFLSISILGIALLGGSLSELWHYSGLLIGGTLAIFLFVFIFNISQAIRYRTLRVFVYDDGLIHVWQTSLKVIAWQNVEAVWHKVISVTTPDASGYRHTYTLCCTDGTELTLGDRYKKREQIWHIIEEETARYLFPTALNTYQMGQAVVFGPLTVTQEGLSYGRKVLPWSEVESIKISESTVDIRMQGKRLPWACVSLGVVPNVEVFKMFVHHMRGG